MPRVKLYNEEALNPVSLDAAREEAFDLDHGVNGEIDIVPSLQNEEDELIPVDEAFSMISGGRHAGLYSRP